MTMNIKKGDTIGIIALSGDCSKDNVLNSKANIEALGYRVKLSDNIYDKNRYLAGSDEIKIEELKKFYLDKDVKLIMAARGGYGAIRLIKKIDYEVIKNNPKPFCGYSDATAILLMIYKKTGIINYHSPMACSDFCSNNKFTQENFFNALTYRELKFNGTELYKSGQAKGIIWGGNLSTIVSLCGQDFIPNKDFIFFTEDINEPVYKIDKMFYQLFNIDKFKKHCKGIVLGDFINNGNDVWLDSLFEELGQKLNIPLSSGFKITHVNDKITLPIGKNGFLDGKVLRIY